MFLDQHVQAPSEAVHYLAQSPHGSVIAPPKGLAQSGVYEIHLRSTDRKRSRNSPETSGVSLSRSKGMGEASSVLDNRVYITNYKASDGHLVERRQAQSSWRFHAREGCFRRVGRRWDKREMLKNRGICHIYIVVNRLILCKHLIT